MQAIRWKDDAEDVLPRKWLKWAYRRLEQIQMKHSTIAAIIGAFLALAGQKVMALVKF